MAIIMAFPDCATAYCTARVLACLLACVLAYGRFRYCVAFLPRESARGNSRLRHAHTLSLSLVVLRFSFLCAVLGRAAAER